MISGSPSVLPGRFPDLHVDKVACLPSGCQERLSLPTGQPGLASRAAADGRIPADVATPTRLRRSECGTGGGRWRSSNVYAVVAGSADGSAWSEPADVLLCDVGDAVVVLVVVQHRDAGGFGGSGDQEVWMPDRAVV